MEVDIKPEVICEAALVLRGAPGFSKEPVHVRSKHGAGVIERKKGIKPYFLKFPLACNTAAPAFDGFVNCFGKVLLKNTWVMRVLIREKFGIWRHDLGEPFKKLIPSFYSSIFSLAVFTTGDLT